ncbi:helix-turn-helix domain-containing protein [Bacteroides stercorirosoris]|uniref:Helix-turn-helix domain-containing protein n=1 Tax=Bacteroides stercorirosoris TaxID=871324 RepID=A0A413H152_9BACE|nr:helix-turn-helix domain-containing protein [Bacteroides stercorirosoris]RGX77158.1 helix-turn-helix domain-containing protein [Bacteroides stercorirosoris]
MPDSEILKTFDEKRGEFKPYGLTCEMWRPQLMPKIDRHNEIELNYIPEGGITYFFPTGKVTVPPRKITLFWGLIPHKIIKSESDAPYFVVTIPFNLFLSWRLPSVLVDRILGGEVVVEAAESECGLDKPMFERWVSDMTGKQNQEAAGLEIQARIWRLTKNISASEAKSTAILNPADGSILEKIVVYIAHNYSRPIKISDIGRAVGLHPDYANAIFKKAFGCTLSRYVAEERIGHVKRKLILTDMSITQIAFDCGFNSISRFNSTFLDICGQTPRHYREQNR